MPATTGKFIVFEGIDGCGKTTQLENLRKRLTSLFCAATPDSMALSSGAALREAAPAAVTRKVFCTREPSDSVPGIICRGVSKKLFPLRDETEAMLFAADRYEHVAGEILPRLTAGDFVLCDRFILSSFAYQGQNTPIEQLYQYNLAAMRLARPDLTVFIDVSPEECERRRAIERATAEKYENVEQARIIRENYFRAIDFLRGELPEILIIDGSGEADRVFETLWATVSKRVL